MRRLRRSGLAAGRRRLGDAESPSAWGSGNDRDCSLLRDTDAGGGQAYSPGRIGRAWQTSFGEGFEQVDIAVRGDREGDEAGRAPPGDVPADVLRAGAKVFRRMHAEKPT